jgi:hypothetical protein
MFNFRHVPSASEDTAGPLRMEQGASQCNAPLSFLSMATTEQRPCYPSEGIVAGEECSWPRAQVVVQATSSRR